MTSDSMDMVGVEPPGSVFRSVLVTPGDKSLSHRSLIFSAMAEGSCQVTGLAPGDDVAATAAALRALGVAIDGTTVVSPGVKAWTQPAAPIDCGNSGTTMRLLAGALSGRPFSSVLTGDESLRRRPMERLVEPLGVLGGVLETTPEGTPPIAVAGSEGLIGGSTTLPMASAQVRSAFALAAVQAEGSSLVESPSGFRDHTERWMESMGRGSRINSTLFRIDPGEIPVADYDVPADPSSAAVLWASAAIATGSLVTTRNVSLNPGRIGLLQVLESMGAGIEAEVTGEIHGDPIGDVTVEGRGLTCAEVSGDLTVATLDELPLLAVLAAYGEGMTVVRDAAELRAKESDRIATTVSMIRTLGGAIEQTDDGFAVVGTGFLDGGTVDAAGDHRLAFAAAVAATRSSKPVEIRGASAVDVSWPAFFDDLETMWSSR